MNGAPLTRMDNNKISLEADPEQKEHPCKDEVSHMQAWARTVTRADQVRGKTLG